MGRLSHGQTQGRTHLNEARRARSAKPRTALSSARQTNVNKDGGEPPDHVAHSPLVQARGKVKNQHPAERQGKTTIVIPRVLIQSSLLTRARFHRVCEGVMGKSPNSVARITAG